MQATKAAPLTAETASKPSIREGKTTFRITLDCDFTRATAPVPVIVRKLLKVLSRIYKVKVRSVDWTEIP